MVGCSLQAEYKHSFILPSEKLDCSGSTSEMVMLECFLKILLAVYVLFIMQMAMEYFSISESKKGLLKVFSVQQIKTP